MTDTLPDSARAAAFPTAPAIAVPPPTGPASPHAGSREHVEHDAATPDADADRTALLQRLDTALATELVSMLRYQRHASMARGLTARAVADEFRAHAHDEALHAELLATRIVQLGGRPDFSPDRLSRRSEAPYTDSVELHTMIRENLVAERLAVDSYRAMVQQVGADDPTTRRLLETILATEEEHADDLASLLDEAEPQAAAPTGTEP